MQQTARLFDELVRYVELNDISVGLILQFAVGGFALANLIKRRIRLWLIAK